MSVLSVLLADGTSKLIDDRDWRVMAVSPPLQVRRHDDGSTIVIIIIDNNGVEETHGELLAPGSLEGPAALTRVAFNWAVPTPCVVDCLRQLMAHQRIDLTSHPPSEPEETD